MVDISLSRKKLSEFCPMCIQECNVSDTGKLTEMISNIFVEVRCIYNLIVVTIPNSRGGTE